MTTPRIINFTLNGMPVSTTIMPHETLVEVLQHRFDLSGPRESCGQGLCGCCTVYVDDRPISGCLQLAVFVDGCKVQTIEGLSDGEVVARKGEAIDDELMFELAIALMACTEEIRRKKSATLGRTIDTVTNTGEYL